MFDPLSLILFVAYPSLDASFKIEYVASLPAHVFSTSQNNAIYLHVLT